MSKEKILVTGACGQIGTELILALQDRHGKDAVVATDIRPAFPDFDGTYEQLDVLDGEKMARLVRLHGITQIYHLAAILSARGEADPRGTWDINMRGLFNVLDIARDLKLTKVYFPSTIAVFGEGIPKVNTPQDALRQPSTVYGISKVSGELWCHYYFYRYGVDVRSIRYPGIIGHKSMPGGGTTDYAVSIYHNAVQGLPFECFLSGNTILPMMYMDDALRATIELMEAPAEQITVRTSYNLAGMSFGPAEIAQSIQKYVPDFQITYKPDFRQGIADTWPQSIDDSAARRDWHWKPEYDLDGMTRVMLDALREKYTAK